MADADITQHLDGIEAGIDSGSARVRMKPSHKIWTLYALRCEPTGLMYVGQTTVGYRVRWAQHIVAAGMAPKQEKTCLHAAIAEHGDEAFTATALASCWSQEAADDLEAHFIATLGTLAPAGFNIRSGGQKARLTPEAGRRRKEQLATLRSTPEWQAANARGLAKAQGPEGRAKASVSLKAFAKTEAGRERVRKAIEGVRPWRASPEGKAQHLAALAKAHEATRAAWAVEDTSELRAGMLSRRGMGMPALAAWNATPEAAAVRDRAQKAGHAALMLLHAAGGAFHDNVSDHLAKSRAQPGFHEHRVSRLKEAAVAKTAATTAKLVALHDAGRARKEIAAETGLSLAHVSLVLRRAKQVAQ